MEMGRQGLLLQEQTWVCIPSAGEHYSGVPAKIPLGGQTEEQLWHPAAGGDAEMVVPGGNACSGAGGDVCQHSSPCSAERLQCNAACTLQECSASSRGDLHWSALHGEILQLCYCQILQQNFLELEV